MEFTIQAGTAVNALTHDGILEAKVTNVAVTYGEQHVVLDPRTGTADLGELSFGALHARLGFYGFRLNSTKYVALIVQPERVQASEPVPAARVRATGGLRAPSAARVEARRAAGYTAIHAKAAR